LGKINRNTSKNCGAEHWEKARGQRGMQLDVRGLTRGKPVNSLPLRENCLKRGGRCCIPGERGVQGEVVEGGIGAAF